MRTLELGQISEDIFFKQIIHEDLDIIVKDIRTQHKTDKTTADTAKSLIKKIPMILLDCLQFKGTLDERRTYIICQMNGVDYKNLSEEERLILNRVFQKSSLYPTTISQRGKSKLSSLFDKKKTKKLLPLHTLFFF